MGGGCGEWYMADIPKLDAAAGEPLHQAQIKHGLPSTRTFCLLMSLSDVFFMRYVAPKLSGFFITLLRFL